MSKKWLILRQLDKQLKDWKAISNKYGQPRNGWVKTIRVSLCMTAEQLAKRLKLTRSRIKQLEKAETHDAVTLRTLREAANAMECDLVYAIVPKGASTLESIVENQAKRIAKERTSTVAHSMTLEAQSIDANALKIQKEELAKDLIEHLNKKLWVDLPTKPERKHKKLIEELKKKK